MNFNSSKTFNIFTDASVKQANSVFFTCAGAVAIFGSSERCKLDNISVSKGTSNYGEIRAILNGILLALEQRDKVDEINVFSDSAFSVYGLRDWSHLWLGKLFNSKGDLINDTFINSSNKPVANQCIFKNIMYLMCKHNMKVNFYHIAGHTDSKGFKRQIDMFFNSNGFVPIGDTLEIISRMNCYVDNLTKSIINKTDLASASSNQRLFSVRFPTCISQVYHYNMLKNEKR